MSDTPILLLVFNRPALTRQLISVLRACKPARIYIAADGARAGHATDAQNCPEVLRICDNEIDWPCEVTKLYRTRNLGCGRAVSHAISWFFEQVEAGIILEDDCVPDASFLTFCTDILQQYAQNEQVLHISGNNFQLGQQRGAGSYYFSRYPHIWGWATWRRAWANYQFMLPSIDLIQQLPSDTRSWLPLKMLAEVQSGRLDTWDTQWLYKVIELGGMCVTPQVNLVRNAGFGEGTHTLQAPFYYHEMSFGSVTELVHPAVIAFDQSADEFSNQLLYNLTIGNKLRDKWRKLTQG
jgi:hypothetical protein